MRAWLTAALLTCGASTAGCTFITSCPNPTDTNNNQGGTNSTGGKPSAGSSNGGSSNGGGGGGGGGVSWTIKGDWANATGNLANMESECGNMAGVFAKPDEDLLIAGIAGKGLWSSSDGGSTWVALGTGAGSEAIVNRLTRIVFDPDDSATWYESGIYHPEAQGVYRTTDNGDTFQALGMTYHVDAISVDFGDPDRKTILAGSHETSQTLFKTSDGGMTWDNIGKGLPAGTDCTHPYLVDADTYLVSCGGYHPAGEPAGPVGIYRSTDGGKNWESVSDVGGGVPIRTTDGSIYTVGAVNTPGVMTRSDDDGKTWSAALAMNAISNTPPAELPNGLLAALNERKVVISNDRGETWTTVTPELDFVGNGVVYSAQRKAFYVWHAICGFSGAVLVPEDAIMSFDFDYEAFPTK